MATVATKLLTAEEFYEWANRPENRDKYCELERGEIVEMPPPGEAARLRLRQCRSDPVELRRAAEERLRLLQRHRRHRRARPGHGSRPGHDAVRGCRPLDDVSREVRRTPPLLVVEVLSPNDTTGNDNAAASSQYLQLRRAAGLGARSRRRATSPSIGRARITRSSMTSEELTGEDVLPGLPLSGRRVLRPAGAIDLTDIALAP